MANDPFRIAIIGGGIGGLFCALAIHHHCTQNHAPPTQIDIYEQASQYKEIGAGIGLGVNAAKLLYRLGLGKKLNSIAGYARDNEPRTTFRRFDNSDEIFRLPNLDQGDVRQSPVARSEFLDLLREAVEERGFAKLWTKKGFEKVEDLGPSEVRIHFTDSSTALADLIIGCDGIHSTVRSQFATDKPIFSGCIAYRGLIPISSLPQPWKINAYAACWIGRHKHFLIYPVSRNEQINIVAFVTKGESEVAGVKESWTTTCDRRDVEEDYKDFDEPVKGIIRAMEERPSKWNIGDRDPLGQWHYMGGKVVLLGDAAHAMLPHLGAGAGQAIEDGWVLGKVLSDRLSGSSTGLADLETAMDLYQRARLPRAQQAQAASRMNGNTFELQTPELLKMSYEEACSSIAEGVQKRTRAVLEEDIDAAYEKAKEAVIPS